ncbi:MAG: hypothetical protein ABSF29_10830 [Tepidisphaeraceae bacterium]|jgi:hypothetical protein
MSTVPSNSVDPNVAPGVARPRTPWWWFPVLALLFFLNWCLFAQWNNPPSPLGIDDLDTSWFSVLQWAHQNHVDFGHDLVFMYGPLYFTASLGAPETFIPVAATWLLLSTAYFAGLFRLARHVTTSLWMAALSILAVILLTGIPLNIFDARLLLLSWLLLLIHFYVDERPWRPSQILLTLAMALAALMKISFFLSALPVVAVIGADQLSRRKVPWTPILYAAAVFAFWLAAGQKIQSLIPYLKNTLELSDGYVEGQMLFPPNGFVGIAQFTFTAILILIALSLVHPWKWMRKSQTPSAPPLLSLTRSSLALLGAAALLFVIFKSGFVRHDAHEITATTALAIMAVTLSTALWPKIQNGMAQTFLVLVALIAIYLSWNSIEKFTSLTGPTAIAEELADLPSRAAGNLQAILGNPAPMKPSQEIAAPVIPPLPSVSGSVDIFPWGQRQLLDQGLDYSPRPVFQSYLTFTPSLLKMNAQFLAGPRAAQTLLFDIQTIDYRFPPQDDSLSWPVLLTKYDLQDAAGSHLILRKSPLPRDFQLVPLASRTARLGETIPVPITGDPIWVTIDLPLTPLGKLAHFLLKPPFLAMQIETQSNSQAPQTYRFQRQAARAGFLLSPQITDRMAFAQLYSSRWQQELAAGQVTALAVRAIPSDDGTSPCYQEQYTIQFFALRYPHFDVSAVPGLKEYHDLKQTFRQMTVYQAPPDSPPQLAENDDGRIVILAHAPTRILIPAPTGAREFHFNFGMPNGTFAVADPTDGVTFNAYIVDTVQGNQISAASAWTRQLDPANVTLDRGLQGATIDLPSDRPTYGVLLEAVPGPSHHRADLYWTNPKYR